MLNCVHLSEQISSVESNEKKIIDVKELGDMWQEFVVLANPGEPFCMSFNDFNSNALHWARKFRRATFDKVHILLMLLLS